MELGVWRGGCSDSGEAAARRPDPRAGNGPAGLRGEVYGRRTAAPVLRRRAATRGPDDGGAWGGGGRGGGSAAAAALLEAAHITEAGSRQRLWRREGG